MDSLTWDNFLLGVLGAFVGIAAWKLLMYGLARLVLKIGRK